MKIIAYVIYLLLLGLHQVILKDLTVIGGASINLAALMIVLVAIYKDQTVTVWFGLCTGLVAAAGTPQYIGWFALLGAALGMLAVNVRERLNLDSLAARLLLVGGGVLLHNVVSLLIYGPSGFGSLLFAAALPGAVYTTVLGWIYFLFKEGHVTMQKLRTIF